jgi:hypothetical protein
MLAILSCSHARATTDRWDTGEATVSAAPDARPGPQPVEVEMSNVDLRVTPDVRLTIRHMRGRFVPAGQSPAPYLDDKHSYLIAIDSGEIAIDMASLNALIARTLAGDRSNVERIRISTDDELRLRQRGVLDKGINVPFDVRAGVAATADGRIRVRADKVRGFGVPMTPVMKMFGVEMDDLMKVKPGHGVTVEGNDVILDPRVLVPPPRIRGQVTSVRVTNQALVQTFGSGKRQRLSPPAVSKNYIYWRGGELKFGKLMMFDTDLELVDDDPRDPFDFSVDHWNDQLVAGYSRNTPSRGLKTHMPDYGDLLERRTSRH